MQRTSAGAASSSSVEGVDLAIDQLYRDHRVSLLRLAVLLTGDRDVAEDVVHDAFVALRPRWAGLADVGRAAGYLRVCVVNGARSLQRRRKVARRHLPDLAEMPAPPADTALMLAAEHLMVAAAVRRLPRRQQQVMALRYWVGMGDTEIADALHLAPATVRSTASRALAALAIELKEST